MLVLTRKIGQQVVLPEQGISIDVVDAGRGRVRLGISAPADVPIHRREVWDRVNGTGNAPPTSSDSPPDPDRLVGKESKSGMAPAASRGDLDECLAQWINARTGGRISELSVERLDDRIVIRGSARSYYVRQLAVAAVNEVLNARDTLSKGSVEYEIDVAQVYWRSAGHTQGLTKLGGAQP